MEQDNTISDGKNGVTIKGLNEYPLQRLKTSPEFREEILKIPKQKRYIE
jgi:hypothetical protein